MPSYTTPRTWVTGEIVTAAELNANIRDNIGFLYSPPCCRVFRSTTQSIANITATAVSFDSETYDALAMHDPATNPSRLTIPTGAAGRYLLHGNVAWHGVSGVKNYTLDLMVNGTTIAAEDSRAVDLSGTGMSHNITGVWVLSVGDYVELIATQNSGSAMNLDVSPVKPSLAAHWIGN